jgi:hydroxymethylglutaryl-CoA lyase
LVSNFKGYERLKQYNFDEFSIVISASNAHNKKNINYTINDTLKLYSHLAKQAKRDNKKFRAYISCAFGCPYEGRIDIRSIIDLSKRLIDMGAYELSISDTIGMANPLQIQEMIFKLFTHVPRQKIALHLHDTRSMALTNIFIAIQLGIKTFDTSFGGLGGCPYAYGTAGNVATEDLISMLYSLNIRTSINLDKLCQISLFVQKILNKQLSSKILSIYNK